MKMTASALKRHYELKTNGMFFTRNNMKFAGDTMSNFYVSAKPVTLTSISGEQRACWELTRRKPVKHGLWASRYFDIETFKVVHLAN